MFIIYTYECVGIADQNDRTYKSIYGTYNKKDGFVMSKMAEDMDKKDLFDKLFHENCWSLYCDVKKMTKDEIEKELGYKIDIVSDKKENDNQNDKNITIDTSKDKNKEFLNNYVNLLKEFYGWV